MERENGIEQNKTYRSFRTSLDMGMGVIYVLCGSMVIYGRYFGTMELNAKVAYIVGGLMAAYGVFRVYRGVNAVFGSKKQ